MLKAIAHLFSARWLFFLAGVPYPPFNVSGEQGGGDAGIQSLVLEHGEQSVVFLGKFSSQLFKVGKTCTEKAAKACEICKSYRAFALAVDLAVPLTALKIFLDEPFKELDVSLRKKLREII